MSEFPVWKIVWSPRSIRDLTDLDDATIARIRRSVQAYAETRHGDVMKLHGVPDRWRLRVGDWRVLFRFDPGNHSLIILVVRNRRDSLRD